MAMTFGKMDAPIGEKCGNLIEEYTCPGCYAGHSSPVTECEVCGAPLKCYVEDVPNYYCQIRDPEEDDG